MRPAARFYPLVWFMPLVFSKISQPRGITGSDQSQLVTKIMQSDPIADLLTRIKNARMAKHTELSVPHSRLKEALVKLMVKTGHLGGYAVVGTKPHCLIEIKKLGVRSARRLSKPGMRLYSDYRGLPRYLKRRGVVIVSTSKGLLPAREAFKQKLGGELICHLI